MRKIYEVLLENKGHKSKVDNIYTYEEAAYSAKMAIEQGANKVYITEHLLNIANQKTSPTVKYRYTESDDGEVIEDGDTIVDPVMSNAEIAEWIENINEDNFIALPITILNIDEKKAFVKLINLYKENRLTQKVKSVLNAMDELLSKAEVSQKSEIDDELEIIMKPLTDAEEDVD